MPYGPTFSHALAVSRLSVHPAPRLYLWIWGTALVALGIGSLIINPNFAVGDGVTDKHLFGVFDTNGWHGLSGASLGVVAVLSAWKRQWTTEAAIAVALVGGLIPAAIFLVSGNDSVILGIIPVDAADIITLHLLPGLIGLLCVASGWARLRTDATSAHDLRSTSPPRTPAS